MASPASPFKAAEESALRGSEALQQVMGKVRLYVEVPGDAPLPYIVIGQHEIEDLGYECGEGHEIVSTVQWWAALSGRVKGADTARAMGSAIIEVMKTLQISGHEVVLVEMETRERYATDPDQSSRGLVAFRYRTTALVA